MSELARCPSTSGLTGIISSDDYAEFNAGWRDGLIRHTKNPAPPEVIEDLALLLDSSALVERINPPE